MADENVGHRQWAHLRFSIIGPLLASPPARGELQAVLDALAQKHWKHPCEPDRWVQFGRSTIEKWYYAAREANDPIAVLSRKVREDRGQRRVMSDALLARLEQQYKAHRRWSYLLHHDNLKALVEEEPELGPAPSYTTLCRQMKKRGLKRRTIPRQPTEGQLRAVERLEKREVRSYERPQAHALWHFDFHQGSLRVVDEHGHWHTPYLFGVLDDCTRIGLHLQWFHTESAHTLYHGLMQTFLKWGLPREIMSDNGAAMIATETKNGFERLGVVQSLTLPYSPYQNGKQESFWTQIEGRLLPMLESIEDLTLGKLNELTLAWLHYEYNRREHSEIDTTPMARLFAVKSVGRDKPTLEFIEKAFTRRIHRKVRRSDATITVDGVRFEIPSRLRHHERLTVRYAFWDLSRAWVVDEHTDEVWAVIRPQDKAKNADGMRRTIEPFDQVETPSHGDDEPLPPLMRKILREYAATGLPPAYIPLAPQWSDDHA